MTLPPEREAVAGKIRLLNQQRRHPCRLARGLLTPGAADATPARQPPGRRDAGAAPPRSPDRNCHSQCAFPALRSNLSLPGST